MPDLSILIPARNEMFLNRTVEDILERMEGDTEIIVICDGNWPDPPVKDHERVTLVYHNQSIGQRAATNEAARLSDAKFVMKCDAHCAFGQGFDVKMMQDCQDNWVLIPEMRNLHAFDWLCKECGKRKYQGPRPKVCEKCGSSEVEVDIVWKPRRHTRNRHMRFDRGLHFQYWREFKQRPEAKGKIVPTMSLIGACWMMPRELYWELGGMDENHGSWGQMGTEIACKIHLSGGELMCTRNTWFAHMFRTQPGFGFPYPISKGDTDKAREYSRWLWRSDEPDKMPRWPGAKYPLSWLVEKFAPVPDWEPAKGIVYYTDNSLDQSIFRAVHKQLLVSANGTGITSVSLMPVDLGENLVLDEKRGILTMFKQILTGLEASTADVIFFCEHDVLYHPSHFDFVPPRKDVFYYNENVWKVDHETGRALFYYAQQTSGLCAYRNLLLEHYRKRVSIVEEHGFSRRMGFEPGTHGRKERVDDYKAESWMSEYPNIDIRHKNNLTPTRWRKDQFRNQRYTQGWTEADEVPFWGTTKNRFKEMLHDLASL